LQLGIVVLSVVVLAMLIHKPVGKLVDKINWGFLTSDGVKAYVAPAVASILGILLLALLAAAVQGRSKLWAGFKMKSDPSAEKD
jgi:hypothetical protein